MDLEQVSGNQLGWLNTKYETFFSISELSGTRLKELIDSGELIPVFSSTNSAQQSPAAAVPERMPEDEQLKRNLALMIRRLSGSLLHYKPDSTIPRQAMEFLARHNLQGSPLRKPSEDADFCAPNSIDDAAPTPPSEE